MLCVILSSIQAKNSNDKDVCYFADLPGYGYAKMSKDKQRTIEVGPPPTSAPRPIPVIVDDAP